MRFPFLLLCIATLILGCDNPETINARDSGIKKLPHDFMFMQRSYPTGTIKTTAYREAMTWKKEALSQRNSMSEVWEFVGPINTGGRITDIEIPINDSNTFYVGTASGGVFKSTNGGATFNPIFDDQEMLSIGDIEISKNNPNTIWVGTGEVNAGGGSLVYDGDGVYKSTDGGLTWQSKGLATTGSIGKVLIDPTNDNTLFVAAMGPLFMEDENRGVYKTTNGGESWEKVLFINNITGVIDMAMHPTNGDILYAATWQRTRRPENTVYGGEGSGLWRSLDGGDTWTEMTNGLPTQASQKGRISIAIAPSSPNVLYTRYADASGNIQGVYRSQDGGNSWQTQNATQLTNVGFHWWFRGIYVDPTNHNVLYNVDFNVQKSIDGGLNWTNAFPGVHVDQHAMAFSPQDPNNVLLGNDGGLYQSTNAGVTATKFETLPITQFYRFYVDPQNNDKIYGGSQDNGTIRTTTGSTNDWDLIFGGDGFQPLVDPVNTNVIYALSQRGNLVKSVNNGAAFTSAQNGIASADRKNWDTPVVFDPANSQVLYYGANRLYKTTNGAANWTAISPDLTNGPYSGNNVFGTIISISVSPLDSNKIVVGTDDGNVWVTLNGGTTWNTISSTLPNRWVTKVLADREDANTIYVTFSGYRYGENEGHVYRSIDNGTTWTNISAGIPDIPVNDIVKDANGILYVATDIGVVASGDEGLTWVPLAANLPSVVVTDMYIHEASQYLYIATYGRSSYKIDVSGDILNTNNTSFVDTLKMYPNPATSYVEFTTTYNLSALRVTVYDALGRIMPAEILNIEGQKARLNIAHLQEGIYYITINEAGRSTTKKLIKK